MPELQAQRTLVKSPPELWAELSDPAALARHLGEFGEIRITRVVPEQTVAWEGERASGTVELSSSGWGTKVTLRARLTETATPASAENATHPSPDGPGDPFALLNSLSRPPLPRPAEPEVEPEAEAEVDAVASEPEVEAEVASEPEVEPEVVASEPDVVAAEIESAEQPEWFGSAPEAQLEPPSETHDVVAVSTARRPGLFARLFGSRSRPSTPIAAAPAAPVQAEPAPAAEVAPPPDPAPSPDVEPTPEPDPSPEPDPTPMPVPQPDPGPSPMPEPDPEPPPAATHEPAAGEAEPEVVEPEVVEPEPEVVEPEAVEPAPSADGFDPERAEAVLTAVLDELGTARHRPFSRG